MNTETETKQKVALFQCPLSGTTLVFDRGYGDTDRDSVCGGAYVRVSEWAEVEFTLRARGDIVATAIAGIDEEIRNLRLDLGRKLQDLEDRKQQLLALPASEQAEAA
jgi:hypothetical protein